MFVEKPLRQYYKLYIITRVDARFWEGGRGGDNGHVDGELSMMLQMKATSQSENLKTPARRASE
jgi:hypothetical protein